MTGAPRGRIPVNRHNPLPLWAQVKTDIERRLRRGEFASAFPAEKDLVREYEVSRHTVREALRSLRQSGLIDAARGRHPRVADAEITPAQGTLYSLFASVEAAGHTQTSIVRALDSCTDETVAGILGLEDDAPLVYLERVRLADEVPLAMDRTWLPARIAMPLLDADFTQTSLYEELAGRCGVRLTGGRERVRAIVPNAAERTLLGIPETTAALAIERIGEVKGQPVEWRTTVVRGDRFSLLTDLSRSEASSAVASHEIPSLSPWEWDPWRTMGAQRGSGRIAAPR
ncbi:MAG TPA: GntR family transcriptional regulator [Amycolatopsis sp.]|nr:GntR family transcriptional regulator [Amycolatopsis sp.]